VCRQPMPVTILLLGFVTAATATDVARRKIYNWTTYAGILTALGLYAAGSLATAGGWVSETRIQDLGWIPFLQSLLGLAACGLVMLLCFVLFRGVGGGDVKLIAMIGAFLGPEHGLTAMLWTFVLGGCMGAVVLIWRVGPGRLAVRALRQLFWILRIGHWKPLTDDDRGQLRTPLFLAPCALGAVVIVQFRLIEWLKNVF
jgi:prepilin peptidase CpaA